MAGTNGERRGLRWAALHAPVVAIALASGSAGAQSLQDLKDMSVEELAKVEVTSVSRRPEPVSDAAAAIFVITGEDIRRSGALTLPEVLRLAPNLEVARQGGMTYAVSARGFNSYQASDKMLILVDGRSVYSPLLSGVFWDLLQPPLDDIERIEVISGPAGATWGANAFDGVINIITKNSRDTQGGVLDLKGGPVDQSGLLQYGGRIGGNATYRIYASGLGVGHTDAAGGHSARDGWVNGQTGTRVDWRDGPDEVTLEGDLYRNFDWQDGTYYGGDLMGRWTHTLQDGSTVQLQASYDNQARVVPYVTDAYSSYDLQAQHTFSSGRNLVVWGGEIRLFDDRFVNVLNPFILSPQNRMVGIGDLFAQDTISLPYDLKLTLGTKVEYSSFTGVDYLPSVRLGWRASDSTFLWAAVSRAVRTPSRIERELQYPGVLLPATEFASEKLIAYEVGYRGRPTADTSLSVSVYYNTYDDIRTTNVLSLNPEVLQFGNGLAGDGYGLEAWGDWRVLPWWRLSAGVNLLKKNLHTKPGVTDYAKGSSGGFDPGYQLTLRSSMDLPHNVELDAGLRAVDALPALGIHSYVTADARVGWRLTPKLELSLAGYNLIEPRHAETVTTPAPILYARRSVWLGLRAGF